MNGKNEDPGKQKDTNDISSFKVPEKDFSLDEVAKHNKKDDLWIAVKGVVLDVTNWLDEHPGGPQALFSHMGKDASEGKQKQPLAMVPETRLLTNVQSLLCCTMMR